MRRLPLCMHFARISILEVRSDSLAVPKLFDQIGKLHLAVRAGVFKRLPLVPQLFELAERHRAVFPCNRQQTSHIGSTEEFSVDRSSGAHMNVVHVEQLKLCKQPDRGPLGQLVFAKRCGHRAMRSESKLQESSKREDHTFPT